MARRRGLNFGYFVNTGNESDVNFVEVMRFVIADPRIKVGAGYIEGLKDGQGLMSVAEDALALGKPLVITKVGRTRAIASHTGSLAGEDVVFDGVIRQRGIVRARSAEEAVSAAGELGYPVALMIESPDIPHKTEAQAVKLGLGDASAVRQAHV